MKENSSGKANGHHAETKACQHLESSGLTLLKRNFHGRFGEIDLIMRDKDIIVFIEVRFRSNDKFMDVIETIDQKKCDRIIKTAMQYMQTIKNPDNFNYRFDVVAITDTGYKTGFEWIKNAFQA